MKKQISTLIGIVIILVSIIIFFGGVFAYQYFILTLNPKVASIQQIEKNTDPACDGVKDQNYILGFGIEHTYQGDIKPGMHVKIVLSCDHKKFTISGAVNQVIQSSDLLKYTHGENIDLADLVAGTGVFRLDSDYNFDGYNDLSTIYSNGQGLTGEKSSFVFLYDPQSNKFVYNNELSSLVNISADQEKREVSETLCGIDNSGGNRSLACDITYYKWVDSHLKEVNKEHSVSPI